MSSTTPNSWMFVPGNKQRFLEKCAELPVHAVLLDLEDGVGATTKDLAREQIAAALQNGAIGAHRYVRINGTGTPWHDADVDGVVRPGLQGICLPKVESADQIRDLSRRLSALEAERGLEAGSVRLLIAIESAVGALALPELAACDPRISGLILGTEDYSLDVGMSLSRGVDGQELLFVRSALVLAARAAGVMAVDGVFPDFGDPEGLAQDGGIARRLGFTGKSLFHPNQIEQINRIFAPSEEEREYAREIIAAFEAAADVGDGAVAVDGTLVDLPIVKRAYAAVGAPFPGFD